jgi:hypothetical protein
MCRQTPWWSAMIGGLDRSMAVRNCGATKSGDTLATEPKAALALLERQWTRGASMPP